MSSWIPERIFYPILESVQLESDQYLVIYISQLFNSHLSLKGIKLTQ
jgi:hypothetical protein